MFALFVMLAPLVAGFILIMVLARFAPNVQRETQTLTGGKTDERPEITGDEFKDLVEELVGSLGLETVFSSMGTGGIVEMTLRDPRPLTGGRILLFATPVLGGPIDSVEVLGFAEGVRADMGALKGIYIALAGFSDEAKTAIGATPAPVDLVDGAAFLELVRTQISPERAGFCAEHRGFGRAADAA
ncbi:MAG: restriction endonuclease [Deltaproteobacteria bacterium]|nr:restriction endonuclease [Deltaproteobacteria bacterium]